MKKNYLSSHKLPKQQSTSFWSQGILGVNMSLGELKFFFDMGFGCNRGSHIGNFF
jgi:hypothetical protein